MKNDEQSRDGEDIEERVEDVEVKLTPILGVAPATYVPIAWGVIVVAVLFLVLLLPGIRNHGTLLTIATEPARASVLVDGVRLGTAPGTFFVPSGTHQLEVRRPGFDAHESTIDVGGRLFGSWIFPRRETIRVRLEGADPASLVAKASAEFAAWSLIGEASGQYQFPPIARGLAADLRALDATSASVAWRRFAEAAMPQVGSQTLVNDLAAGALSMGGGSGVAVPSGIAATLEQLGRFADEAPLLPLQLSGVVSDSAWGRYAAARAEELSALVLEGSRVLAGARRDYALGLRFTDLPGGDVVLGGSPRAARGGDVPYRISLAPYAISSTEVPFSLWERFVEANPRWRVANADELIAEGVVDEGYLSEIDAMRENPSLPITGISAYAANAFASWYTTLLPDGLVARLPTEAEWEFALGVSQSDDGVFANAGRAGGPVSVDAAGDGRAGIIGMLGNVWEWTADWFAPYGNVYANGSDSLPAAHRVVRGGGWATPAVGFDAGDRGSMDPSWCSPFVGIRLVVSPLLQ